MARKLVKTFSFSDFLVDSPSTSPIAERPPLASMDNYDWLNDDVLSLPSMPDPSFPLAPVSVPDDSLLFSRASDDVANAVYPGLLLAETASILGNLFSAASDPEYHHVAYPCESACINPAALRNSSPSSTPNVLEPQDDPQGDAQVVVGLPQDQVVRDCVKSEPAGPSKRKRRHVDVDRHEYTAEASDAESERRRPRKAARRQISYPSPPVSTSEDDDQEKHYPCTHCGRRFRRDAERVRHEYGHLPTAEQALTCTVCNRSVGGARKDAMRRHQLRTALCIKIQEEYTDEELKSMKCVTRVEREAWKKRQDANKNRSS